MIALTFVLFVVVLACGDLGCKRGALPLALFAFYQTPGCHTGIYKDYETPTPVRFTQSRSFPPFNRC